MRCWCGYFSGALCKWFAYGPADAAAPRSSLASLKFRLVWPFWCWLTQVVLEKRSLNGWSSVGFRGSEVMRVLHRVHSPKIFSATLLINCWIQEGKEVQNWYGPPVSPWRVWCSSDFACHRGQKSSMLARLQTWRALIFRRVCLSVCLCVCVWRRFYPSTLTDFVETDFDETWSQGPYCDLVWPRP